MSKTERTAENYLDNISLEEPTKKLLTAVLKGDLEAIRTNKDVDLNAPINGVSLLSISAQLAGQFTPGIHDLPTDKAILTAREKASEVVGVLLEKGADPKIDSAAVIASAMSVGNQEVVAKVVAAGAEVKGKDGVELLHHACNIGQDRVASVLINSGVDVNAVSGDGKNQTALHTACEIGNKDLARMLITAGANVNAVDNKGDTPLHFAARAGNAEMCTLLVSNRARYDIPNKAGIAASNEVFYNKQATEIFGTIKGISKGEQILGLRKLLETKTPSTGRPPLQRSSTQARGLGF